MRFVPVTMLHGKNPGQLTRPVDKYQRRYLRRLARHDARSYVSISDIRLAKRPPGRSKWPRDNQAASVSALLNETSRRRRC